MVTDAPHAAFGRRLRAARVARGLSEVDVARALVAPVVRSTVTRWEDGTHEPTGEVRREVAAIVHCPFHRLFPPEETAARLTLLQSRLLLRAARRRGGGEHWYFHAVTPMERSACAALIRLYLVEDNGNAPHGDCRLFHLTLPGLDVRDVLVGDAEELARRRRDQG